MAKGFVDFECLNCGVQFSVNAKDIDKDWTVEDICKEECPNCEKKGNIKASLHNLIIE